MELKQGSKSSDIRADARFNRTFMELKRVSVQERERGKQALIGPLWN